MPGQEYTIDLVIPGSKPLDYTDNAMPAFLLAPVDAADAKSACEASGYRLPTYNEGLMILFHMEFRRAKRRQTAAKIGVIIP